MTTLQKGSNVPQMKQAVPIFVVLVAAGLAGNYYCTYELFFNIQFIIGSVFAMLVLQLLGLRLGALAALLISSITYQLWNHPYAIIIMTGEVVVVGLLVQRRAIRMVVADALYWVMIGMPLVYLFFHRVMDLPSSIASITMVKQAVNGIANTLAARLIFMALSWRLQKTRFSLQEVVFNLLAVSTLATALFLLAGQGRRELADTDLSIRGALGLASQRVSVNLRHWLQDHNDRIAYLAKRAATASVPHMQESLELVGEMNRDFLRIGLLDEEANSVAFFPLTDERGQSTIGRNWSDRPFIPTLKRTLRPMLSEVVIGKVGYPLPVVISLAPVVSDGQYAGYIAGVLDLQRVRTIIAENASSQMLPDLLFTLVDKNGRIIATNRDDLKVMEAFRRGEGELKPLDGGFSQWLPLHHKNVSIAERWKSSFYVAASEIGQLAEWRLILELPIAPVQRRLYEKYATYLTEVLAMLLIALVFAKVMSHWAMVSLETIKSISTDIPAKLSSNEDIVWPETHILETAGLIDNFRAVSRILARQLNEIRGMNVVLEERVSERTRDLRESEERFRNFFEHAKVVALTLDPTDGTIIDANAAAVTYYGWPRERLLAMKIAEINTLPSPELSDAMGVARLEKQSSFFFKHRLADGSIRDVEVFSGPIHSGGQTVLYSIVHDITERRRAEESLRQSEERLRFLSENLAEGMVYQIDSGQHGEQRQFVYLSPAVERLHGLTVEEVQANPQHLYAQVIEEHQAIVAGKEAQAIASMSTFDVEVMVRLPSGERRWRRIVSAPRPQPDGSILWNGIEFDITDHKRMEEALRKSEALLRQTQQLSRVGGWEYEVDRQRVSWTEEVYRIYEVGADYDPNDIQKAVSFYAEQDQEVIARSFRRAVEEGEAYDLELQFVSANGARKWVRTTGQAECIAGRTVRVFGHIMDVTERKQAEIEREQYFTFFTTSADLMAFADPNGCFKKVNPACLQTLGYSEEELISKPFIEFVHPDDRQATLEEMARQLQKSFSLDFENRYLCKDASVRWLSWRASYNKDEGLTYATARDITIRKQVEEQMRQSLREKETLLKEVHHRVKNNLAVISSLLNLQAKQIKDDSLKAMFDESQQRIKSIALVHEKLYRSQDLSRINFSDYIATIIGELRSSYRTGAREIGVTISTDDISLDIDTAIPCGLIINELVTNALKYAFPANSSGKVGVSVTESDTFYTLTVKDNGIGLPPGFDHTRTGTLGLQLVEALTRQLGGTLQIRAEGGTEAIITFRKKGAQHEKKEDHDR